MNESATGSSGNTDVDWKALILECGWLDRLERLTIKRFGEGGLAEEASSYVIDKLSQDNWQMLGAFKGQSKPETYLHTLANNLIEEFSRKRFGRPRPPEWIKRQGNFWVTVWKLLCLERRMPQSIVELLTAGDLHNALDVSDTMRTIKAKIPRCGEAVREVTMGTESGDDDGDNLQNLIPSFNTPDAEIEQSQMEEMLEILSLLLNRNVNNEPEQAARGKARQVMQNTNIGTNKTFHHHLDFSDTEWVVLRMIFQDGINLSTIAKTLGMKAHEPGRIKTRIIEKIRDALGSSNLDLDTIKSML